VAPNYAKLISEITHRNHQLDHTRIGVDHEGEVFDILVQRRRDTRAASPLMSELLKKQGFAPKSLVTDKLSSYASAFRRLRLNCPHEQGDYARTTGPKTRIRRCDAALLTTLRQQVKNAVRLDPRGSRFAMARAVCGDICH